MALDFAPKHWSTSTRLVAIAIADRVNSDTQDCFPSVADIARRTGLNERSVQRHLRHLEADGTITNMGQRVVNGRPQSNVYRWNLWMKVGT